MSYIEKRAFTEAEAAVYICRSRSYLRYGRNGGLTGDFIPPPQHTQIGRRVVYLREHLDAWLDQFAKQTPPPPEPVSLRGVL